MPKTETLLLFGTLLCRGLKVILRIGLNLTCLGSVGLTTEKFPVASRRAQSLDHSLFTRTIFLMSLAWLNLYCLPMIQIFFVLIGIPTTLFLFANNELKVQKWFSWLKVARYSFSRSIPPKFERKLRRHKQRFGKIDTTVVLDKDENLLWSWLQWHRSCHSNEMMPLPILLAAWFLGTGNCSSKIVYWSFFLQ